MSADSRFAAPRHVVGIALACMVATACSTASARAPVYFTDFDSPPAVRPVTLDGNATFRSGPFRHWRGWGTEQARATVRYRNLRTTVVMRDIRRCAGRRQYRKYAVSSYRNGRRVGSVRYFVNRACRK